jgi:tyrosine-protein phosphatase 2/3
LDLDKHRTTSHAGPSSTVIPADYGRRRANTTMTFDASVPTPTPSQPQAETPYVIIRKFAMSHNGNPFSSIREITHLHYPSWPDFGAPAQPSHLLALVELSNVMQRAALPIDANAVAASALPDAPPTMTWYDEPEHLARARPIVVHCSAGCGRTGTFCTVDSVIDMLKRQRLVALAASQGRDNDGDVGMDDCISPSAVVEDVFPRRNNHTSNGNGNGLFRSNPFGVESDADDSGIDTSWIGDDSVDLIQKTVEDFRGQRLSMVQSLRQFVLCYEAVLEWVWRLQERSNPAMSNAVGRARSGSMEQARR